VKTWAGLDAKAKEDPTHAHGGDVSQLLQLAVQADWAEGALGTRQMVMTVMMVVVVVFVCSFGVALCRPSGDIHMPTKPP